MGELYVWHIQKLDDKPWGLIYSREDSWLIQGKVPNPVPNLGRQSTKFRESGRWYAVRGRRNWIGNGAQSNLQWVLDLVIENLSA